MSIPQYWLGLFARGLLLGGAFERIAFKAVIRVDKKIMFLHKQVYALMINDNILPILKLYPDSSMAPKGMFSFNTIDSGEYFFISFLHFHRSSPSNSNSLFLNSMVRFAIIRLCSLYSSTKRRSFLDFLIALKTS